MLAGASQLIEYGCFSGVRVARKGNDEFGFHGFC
jgi:hypothetical protein